MKRWLVVLGALTLVGCSDGDIKEELEVGKKQETEEVETVKDENKATPISTQTPVQTISEEDKLKSDSILGMLYIEELEEALKGYIQVNEFFNEAREGRIGELQVAALTDLINLQVEELGTIKSSDLYDKEYQNRLEGYHEAMVLSYEALVNFAKIIPDYNNGLVADKSFLLVESAYDNSVSLVSTLRDYAIEYHNANFAE